MSVITLAKVNERDRRRRILRAVVVTALIVAGLAAAAVTLPWDSPGSALAVRPSGGPPRGVVCARTPAGWLKQTGSDLGDGPKTVGLTNFRFGLAGDPDTYGLASYAHRPRGSITIVLDSSGPWDSTHHRFKRSLRVTRADFFSDPYGEVSWPSANIIVRRHGGVRTAVVEVGAVTPATIAAANRALAGVRTCSR